jgi:hypothetical protein
MMNFNEWMNVVREHWASFLVAIVLVVAIAIPVFEYLYKVRISERDAKILGLESQIEDLKKELAVLTKGHSPADSATIRSLSDSSVSIESFDKIGRVASGGVVLSRNDRFLVLLYAGKAGGPYWLQGGNGQMFSEDERKQIGVSYLAKWTISEVHVGANVTDLRAVLISPGDLQKFLAAGSADPQAGSALKISSINSLPEPKVVSPRFDPTRSR